MGDTAKTILEAAAAEPFGKMLGITCHEAGEGSARCSMVITGEMLNIFGMAHGGAIFSLIDDVFQLACNSRDKVAYALNVSTTYVSGAAPGDTLTAVGREVSLTNRTGLYEVIVKNQDGTLIASSQALAYRKKEETPFV